MSYETEEYKGFTLKIEVDEDPMNPRTEWDNLTTFAFRKNNNYTLGDEKEEYEDNDEFLFNLIAENEFSSEQRKIINFRALVQMYYEMNAGNASLAEDCARKAVETKLKNPRQVVILGLDYADYGSSGCHFSETDDFEHADGFAYVTLDKLRGEFGRKPDEELYEHGLRSLRGEIATYKSYLEGDVFGYVIENSEGEEIYSCWGFLGESDYCLAEARSSVDGHIKYNIKQHIKQVKTWIRNRVPLHIRKGLDIYAG